MRRTLSRVSGIGGLVIAQLRTYRLASLLAVAGIAMAVLLMVLIAGLGTGVTTAGSEGLQWLDQDLWVSAGPLRIAPHAVGGVDNPLLDSHETADRIRSRDGVRSVGILSFQAVYVSVDGESYETVVGVGVSGNGTMVDFSDGGGFTRGDTHYANGTYAGPMSNEVIIDERTASRLNVSVGETLYIGGTVSVAREHPYRIVDQRSTFSTFLGTATVTVPLSELQTLTGTTGNDPASLLTINTEPGADTRRITAAIERENPTFAVRTNREQLTAVIGRQSALLASTAALVVIAIVIGLALVVNVLGLLVHQQRAELAALQAVGISSRTLVAMIGGQSIAIGLIGGIIGMALAPVVAGGLNPTLDGLTGFAKLIKLRWWVLVAGGILAVAAGLLGAVIVGWRMTRLPLDQRLTR